MGIAWIASYPKSGNTWVRFLLANYLAGPIEHSAQVEAVVPDFSRPHDAEALLRDRPVVYAKSHFRWGPDHPYAALTDRAVVIVRHPKDVLLSNLAYDRLLSGRDQGYSDAQFIRAFIETGGDPRWVSTGFGTLEEHVLSWLDAPASLPRHVIRYRDLKADVPGVFSGILGFLGLAVDAERVALAVSRSSFEQMRAMEVREKAARKTSAVFAGPPPRPGKPRYFMNEGKTRFTLAHIDPELDRLFDQRFGGLMKRLGYVD